MNQPFDRLSVGIRLPVKLNKRLREIAEERDESFNSLCVEYLEDGVRQEESKDEE